MNIEETKEAIRAWPDTQSLVYCLERHGDIEAHDPIALRDILALVTSHDEQAAEIERAKREESSDERT